MESRIDTSPPQRPSWAQRLDAVALLVVRIGHRLLSRPSEATLSRLARRDRPGMTITLPEGTVDALSAGRAAFEAGRYADALHHFGVILEHDPDHPWAWHGRGDALQLMGAHKEAQIAYETASGLQPEEALHRAGIENARRALSGH